MRTSIRLLVAAVALFPGCAAAFSADSIGGVPLPGSGLVLGSAALPLPGGSAVRSEAALPTPAAERLDRLDRPTERIEVLSRSHAVRPTQVPPADTAALARLSVDMAAVSAQLTRIESRLTALERRAVEPFRSPATLTDPLAAAAAGRRVGGYDQFGRFVGFAQVSTPAASTFAAASTQAIQAAPSAPLVFSAPVSLPAAGYVGAVGCSGGSCGAGGCSGGSCRRTPIRTLLFGRR